MLRRNNSVVSNPGLAKKPEGAVDIVEAQRRHNRAQSVGAYSLERGVMPTGVEVKAATPELHRSDSDYSSGSDEGGIKSIGMPMEDSLIKGEKSAHIKSIQSLHGQLDSLVESLVAKDFTQLKDLEAAEREVSGISFQLDVISIFIKSSIDDLDYEKQLPEDSDYIPMAPAPVTTQAADAIRDSSPPPDKFATITPKAGKAVLAAIQSGHYNVPRKAVTFNPLETVHEYSDDVAPFPPPEIPNWMRIREV